MLEFPVSETIADGERIADIVFIAGGGNSQQAVLHFGADDEVSDDEIEPDTDARVPVADRVRSRSWNLGTQQSGEVGCKNIRTTNYHTLPSFRNISILSRLLVT